MFHRPRSITGALASLALVLVLGACSDSPTTAEQIAPDDPLAKNTSVKYTFEDVTLSDGVETVENAVIEAVVKDHKNDKNDWTNCAYFTEDWQESLGTYGEAVVPGDGGEDAVRAFCVDSFADRQ